VQLMKFRVLYCLALAGSACIPLVGCAPVASPGSTSCETTFTVTPATATLDHSVADNSQTYSLGISIPKGCPLPPFAAPRWTVSDTIDASITAPAGVASCKNAAMNPIVVSPGSGLPTATLICQ
jgi:hypothetical protein